MRFTRCLIMTVALCLVCSAGKSRAESTQVANYVLTNIELTPPNFEKSVAKEDLGGKVRSAIAVRLGPMGYTVTNRENLNDSDRKCLAAPTHECLQESGIPKDTRVLWGKIAYHPLKNYELQLRLWHLAPSGSLASVPLEDSGKCKPKCSGDALASAMKELAGGLLQSSSHSESTAIASLSTGELSFAPKPGTTPTRAGPAAGTEPKPATATPAPVIPKDAAGGSPPSAASTSSLHPRLASAVLGLTWGGFVLSAGATVALFAGNRTGLGTIETDGYRVDHVLTPAAWTAAGLSALTLAIAIPTTVLARRAGGQAPTSPSAALSH